MNRRLLLLTTLGLVGTWLGPLPEQLAADPPSPAIPASVARSLTLIEKSSAEYRQHRECFSCHHQALSVLTAVAARQRGFAIDEENLRKQLEWTAAHLKRGEEDYRQGRGQGGHIDTAGYALWTLAAGGWKPDASTAAVVEYILSKDTELGYWETSGNRPPSEASHITTTAVAVRGLTAFGAGDLSDRVATRLAKVRPWISQAEIKDTEDRVFQMHALQYVQAPAEELRAAARAVKQLQREDGGWSQTPEMSSDAYATGTALVALFELGGCEAQDPDYQRGVKFLLESQQPDGSWHVQSRSKPFQTYFESGFPHGKDQFISMAASCWATIALIYACPLPEPSENPPAPGTKSPE